MYLGIDIGGTNTRIGLLDETRAEKQLLHIESFPTIQNYEKGTALLVSQIQTFITSHAPSGIKGIGFGFPGVVDLEKQEITVANNLKDWVQKPLTTFFESKLGVPIKMQHDVALAALGEARYGLGKDVSEFIYVIWGTGVGAVAVKKIAGKLTTTSCEPGNHIIVWDGDVCTCGQKGCLEAYIGGWAIEKRYKKAISQLTESEWDEVARYGAQGFVNLVAFYPTLRIVFGGGVIQKQPHLLEKIEGLMRQQLHIFPMPALHLSSLGEHGGLYGSLALFTT